MYIHVRRVVIHMSLHYMMFGGMELVIEIAHSCGFWEVKSDVHMNELFGIFNDLFHDLDELFLGSKLLGYISFMKTL